MRLITCGALGLALLTFPGVASAKQCGDDAAVATAREVVAMTCPCDSFKNHGQYMKCVTDEVNTLARGGNLPNECKGEVVSCAAHSTCGKKGAVTCCRVDGKGKVKCTIKSSAAKCTPSHGGVACVGTATSCCDACAAGSADGAFTCGGSTTSTTTPVSTTSSSTGAAPTSSTSSSTAMPTTSSTSSTTAAPATSSTSSSTLLATTTSTSSTTSTTSASPSGAFVGA